MYQKSFRHCLYNLKLIRFAYHELPYEVRGTIAIGVYV